MVATVQPTAAELFDSVYRLALATAHKWGRRLPCLRDDFLSDALLRVWRAAVRHTGTADEFRNKVGVIASRACIDRIRRERLDRTAATGRGDDSSADVLDLAADRDGPDPADRLDAATLLDRLNDQARRVVERHAVDGLAFEAIGVEIGVSEWRARGMYSRAVTQLRGNQ